MADERDQELKASQTPIQIREGAGLEEARYNVEFIEWLRKWSGPLMIVVALAAGGFALSQHLAKREKDSVDAAFAEFEAASQGTSVNPDTLIAIADQHAKIRAVPVLARLRAGDVFLDSVRRGVKPGAVVSADGTLASAEDELKASEREGVLAQAQAQYQWVLDKTANDPKGAVHTLGALYGLAAVAESRGDNASAKGFYERVIQLAEQAKFAEHAALAKARIESLDRLATLDPVPARASVPAPLDTTPAPETPAPTGAEPAAAPAPASAPGSTQGSESGTSGSPAPATPAPGQTDPGQTDPGNPAPPK